MVHRNQLRLLKLVNALLDFSRIEAGRAQATYRPTDISALTRELAGAFRSAIEHAGLRFDVDCPPIAAPVYVDRDMWEKIVLNLLSNALKFTFEGSIRIAHAGARRPHRADRRRIPAPASRTTSCRRVFERFHRVEGVRSRTHEGSGIGLALTHELVRLHGGDDHRREQVWRRLHLHRPDPAGSAHLPQSGWRVEPRTLDDDAGSGGRTSKRRRAGCRRSETASRLRAHGGLARRGSWSPTTTPTCATTCASCSAGGTSRPCGNGADALERARTSPPNLVVTDVMMPELDGFGLLRRCGPIRGRSAVPVLMLSARAGEEARVSGLAAGADDYVVKPFSARELIARVRSLLALAEARREAELQKQHLHALFMQAPTPIVILEGPNHVVELANPMTCRLWDRDVDDVLNRPLFDALPELERQPFKVLLDDVFRTGEPYVGKEAPARLDRRGDGSIETRFLNFVYQPRRNVDGRGRGDSRHRVRCHRRGEAARRAERAAGGRAVGQPHQGRVPGHARPRAAQSARAHPDGAAADDAARRYRRRARTHGHRPAGAPPGPARRRSRSTFRESPAARSTFAAIRSKSATSSRPRSRAPARCSRSGTITSSCDVPRAGPDA